ncbi:MAG TPA: MFS transporter [Lacunisphaera sp.]|nr:MFS transporter [Lacunisphaera sp.]
MCARAASFAPAVASRRELPTIPIVTNPPSERLSFKEKLAYGLGDTASNFYFQFFNSFLVFYYTDIFGLPSARVENLTLWAPIAVAALNPIIGLLADRTSTRWGKFRPFLLWGAIPYGLLGFLMFTNPALSVSGRLVFAYVTYSLVLVIYAFINTPYGALMGVMSPSAEDRTSLSSYRFACAFLGALLVGWLVPHLKDFLTPAGGSPADGFRNTMAIFAVLSVAMFVYTFANTRERVAPPARQESSLKEDLRVVGANWPWIVLFVAGFLNLANVGLRNGAGIYYFKYVVGNEAAIGNFNFVGFLCFILGALATKLFTSRFPRKPLMVTFTLINGAGMVACYFVDPHNLPLLYACHIVASFAAGPTPAIVWSLYADTADYGEWKFGRRTTGLIFSATVFGQKVGLAIGSFLIAKLLTYYGFVANVAQAAPVQHGITLMFAILPGCLGLLSGLSILLYAIDEPQVKQIERDLAARKAGAAPAPA